MALIKCKECGKEISENSDVCIHCGCKLRLKQKFDIFRYKNIFLNLLIFVITVPILLGRKNIINSQNEYIKIWMNHLSEQEEYKKNIFQTNIICIIAMIVLIYAVINTYKILKEKNIKSKLIDFVVRKLQKNKNVIEKIRDKIKIIVCIFTVITIIVTIVVLINKESFIYEFKQEFEIYEEAKTNELLLEYQDYHLEKGFKDITLYILIICYMGMFLSWKIKFDMEKEENYIDNGIDKK